MGRKTLLSAVERFLLRVESVVKSTNPEDYPAIRAGDKAAPGWITDFLEVVRDTQDRVVLKDVMKAVARGDFAAVEAAIPWGFLEESLRARWQPAIISLMEQGAIAATGAMPPPPPGAPEMTLAFDLTNPRAVAWAEARTGELIRHISSSSHEAIRQTITSAFTDSKGKHPYESAKEIKSRIGLLPAHEQAVAKYKVSLMRERVNGKHAYTEAQIRLMTKEYAQKLLRYRAENIARTETLTASHQGQLELWNQAIEQGYLDHDQLMRWVVTRDDRLCEECAPMHDLTAPIHSGFPGVGLPPLHPSCRCTVVLDMK